MDNVVKIMHLEESHLHELVPYFADYSELSIETKEQFNQVKVILDRIMYQDLLQIEVFSENNNLLIYRLGKMLFIYKWEVSNSNTSFVHRSLGKKKWSS